ncbi:MAG: D-hexose-6-phosphate mutarotase [Rubrivivax sp.]
MPPAGPVDAVSFERRGALPCVRLRTPQGDEACVSLFGAQLLSWQPAGGDERLFLGARSRLDGLAPIRGGVPVVFPQFADLGPLPAHGLARTAPWQLQHSQADAGGTRATLGLRDDALTRACWPHAFACELGVHLQPQTIEITWRLSNPGPGPLRAQAALHTYLRVADVHRARLLGLDGAAYRDRRDGARLHVQAEPALRVADGLDRLYVDAPRRLRLDEPGTTVEVLARGFADVVVWNPGPERAASIADLAPGDERRLVCVEAAAVETPIALQPGESWQGAQRLTRVAPLTGASC